MLPDGLTAGTPHTSSPVAFFTSRNTCVPHSLVFLFHRPVIRSVDFYSSSLKSSFVWDEDSPPAYGIRITPKPSETVFFGDRSDLLFAPQNNSYPRQASGASVHWTLAFGSVRVRHGQLDYCKKQPSLWDDCFFGAGDRTRTGTLSPAEDFESSTSTIPSHRHIVFSL